MSTLLHIVASPRGERAKSRRVASALVEAYRQHHPDDEIVELDLFAADLPAFDGPTVQAKYNILHGQESSPAERRAWDEVEAIIGQFTDAQKYVFSVPMWNFGIPYRLKQYVDILVQPTYTFSYDPESGYSGLLTDRKAVVVYARGGDYSSEAASAMDFQKPYMETILGFIGIIDVEAIVVEPTLAGGTETAQSRLEEAVARAKSVAATF